LQDELRLAMLAVGAATAPTLPANAKGVVQLTAPDGKVRQGQFK
jgi:hypothetical protein